MTAAPYTRRQRWKAGIIANRYWPLLDWYLPWRLRLRASIEGDDETTLDRP